MLCCKCVLMPQYQLRFQDMNLIEGQPNQHQAAVLHSEQRRRWRVRFVDSALPAPDAHRSPTERSAQMAHQCDLLAPMLIHEVTGISLALPCAGV